MVVRKARDVLEEVDLVNKDGPLFTYREPLTSLYIALTLAGRIYQTLPLDQTPSNCLGRYA